MPCTEFSNECKEHFMALKTNFPTINSWTTQSSLWGGVWVVIAISSFSYIRTVNIICIDKILSNIQNVCIISF